MVAKEGRRPHKYRLRLQGLLKVKKKLTPFFGPIGIERQETHMADDRGQEVFVVGNFSTVEGFLFPDVGHETTGCPTQQHVIRLPLIEDLTSYRASPFHIFFTLVLSSANLLDLSQTVNQTSHQKK